MTKLETTFKQISVFGHKRTAEHGKIQENTGFKIFVRTGITYTNT